MLGTLDFFFIVPPWKKIKLSEAMKFYANSMNSIDLWEKENLEGMILLEVLLRPKYKIWHRIVCLAGLFIRVDIKRS